MTRLSKSWYRSYFADVQKYVKMKNILADLGMSGTNYYRFMKGSDWDYVMSIEMLERVKQELQQVLENFT